MRLVLFLSFWLIAYPFLGQQRQLVLFKDKTNSPYSLENPAQYLSLRAIARRQRQGIPIQRRDLPVNPSYVNELKNKGAKVLYTSRWLNGAVVEANASVLSSLQTLSFVKSVGIPVGVVHTSHYAEHRPNDIDYGRAAAQNKMLGIDEMHRQGYKGKGIIIAVMDAGFERVKQNPLMTGIDILDTYDFVDNETDVYDDDSHGAKVLSTIAANGKGIMVGAAFEASFYLYRTEDVRSETRLEEVYWTIAAERADSLGADIISNSLAYSTFDAPDISYTLENLNGDYALISQAADWAASTGMLVVTSADNLGYNTWRKISFPADADSVLAVGAVTPDGRRAGFSSVGNTVDNRIKPDVVALGENAYVLLSNGVPILASGTSYSAPQVAGLAAGLWQAFPHLSNMKLLEIIRLSGSQMSKPDSLLGYGIPHFTRAKELAAQVVTSSEKNTALQNVKAYPNPLRTPSIYLDFPDMLLGKEIEIKLFDLTGHKVFDKILRVDAPQLLLEFDKTIQQAQQLFLLQLKLEKEITVLKISNK